MIYIPESEDIYFSKTREYFNEVLSSYAIGNYRSAVVMLYSVAICDLLFKLQELSDMYDDSVAKEILSEVEKCKNQDDRKSKSRWEKEFVDNIYKKTQLLDLESYTNLNHLYDHRNFSAHPALNDDYILVSPSKETTIAHIKNILENILVKPPIFIKKVTELLLNDLAEKKDLYAEEDEKLKEYLQRKYFDRMSLSMKENLFRTLWKLCFCLPDDENCMRNLVINRKAMRFLFDVTPEMLEYMKTEKMFERVSSDMRCIQSLCLLLARYPQIYQVLSEDTKMQLTNAVEKDANIRLISWFMNKNKKQHINNMREQEFFRQVDEGAIKFAAARYEEEGILPCFIDYCIDYYGDSKSFDAADKRFRSAIRPYISKLSHDQMILLIKTIDSNSQIYNRTASYIANTIVAYAARRILGDDFDYSKYPHFKFDEVRVFGDESTREQNGSTEEVFLSE